MEISDFNDVKGCPWPDFWEGQGNGEAREAIEAARGGRSSRFQAGANTAKGNARWWDVQVSPILDADGNPVARIRWPAGIGIAGKTGVWISPY